MDKYKNNTIIRQQLVGPWEVFSDMKLGHSVLDIDHESDTKWLYIFHQDGSYTQQYQSSIAQRPEPIKEGTWSFANDTLSIVENDREKPSGLLESDTKGIRSIDEYHLVMEGLDIMNFETGYNKSYNYFIHFIKQEDF